MPREPVLPSHPPGGSESRFGMRCPVLLALAALRAVAWPVSQTWYGFGQGDLFEFGCDLFLPDRGLCRC